MPWVSEDNLTGSAAGPAPIDAAPNPSPWQEEVLPSWGQRIGQGLTDAARVAASNVPLWDRARALPDVIGGKPYSQAVNEQVAETQAARDRLGPFMASSSDIAGGAALGAGMVKSGLTTLGRGIVDATQPLWKRLMVSGVEAGTHGAIQAANQTYSENLPDYVKNATIGGTLGGALGTALPAVGAGAQAIYKGVSDRFSGIPVPVLKAGAADAAGLQNLNRLGPDAMLPDAGPSMQATAQAAIQGVGDNRTTLINALKARDADTVPRLQADRTAALGAAPRVSQVEQGIDTARQQINANDYGPILSGRTIAPQAADNTITALRALGQNSRVNLDPVIGDLQLNGAPDLSAQSWMRARYKIDTSHVPQARTAGDRYRAQVLGDARDMIDNQLAAHVPGIKAADAKFAANRAELEALTQGQALLDKGKNAVHPQDLRDILTAAPPQVAMRMRQGAHADLERKLGTQANDLNELEKTVGTPQDWNAQKMAAVFGPQPAQAVSDSVARNRQFRETYQRVAQGSDTAQRIAAREDTQLKPLDLGRQTAFGTALAAGGKVMNLAREAGAQQQRDAIARLMALRNPQQIADLSQRILGQNAATAQAGPTVNRYVRGALQGGAAGGVTPLITGDPLRVPIDTTDWQ